MPPITLFNYLSLRALGAVAVLTVALSALILFVDLIESLRFLDKVKAGDFGVALTLSLLRAPAIAQALLPFVFLFASIWLFTQLNRQAEIPVMRAAGLSVWRLIGPAAFVAGIGGFAVITAIDPLAAAMRAESDKLRDSLRGASSSMVRVLGDGVWLRQRDADNILLINARSVDAEKGRLTDVVVWRLGRDSSFVERIDSPEAVLSSRTIELHRARIKGARDRLDYRSPVYAIPTMLTAADLRERLEPPESLSLWRLPRFILLAEAAGVPTSRYNMRFHDLCATPLKLIAMVLIAALCSLRPIRGGGAFRMFGLAVAAGFLLYVLTEIAAALGESGAAPVALAAWAPAIVASAIAAAGLLQFEDG
jgi:lipopolysaccharide export system permease protein